MMRWSISHGLELAGWKHMSPICKERSFSHHCVSHPLKSIRRSIRQKNDQSDAIRHFLAQILIDLPVEQCNTTKSATFSSNSDLSAGFWVIQGITDTGVVFFARYDRPQNSLKPLKRCENSRIFNSLIATRRFQNWGPFLKKTTFSFHTFRRYPVSQQNFKCL